MRRIQRDASHEEFIKSLISGDDAIFRDIWRILLFAAAYGVKERKRTPLQKVESNKSFPESYFNTPAWKGFLYLIGFAETETSDHLKNEDEQQEMLVTAFEEYANYGLIQMREKLGSSTDRLGDLVEFISNNLKDETPSPDVANLEQL